MRFYDLVQVGFVSIWAGNLKSHPEFDRYLVKEFPSDYGFKIDPQGKVEGKVEGNDIAIAALISGFSRSKTFQAKCIQVAEAKQNSSASCMLVIYDFRYDE